MRIYLIVFQKEGVGICIHIIHTYIHTYHSRFVPEGVAETSQILLLLSEVML
jgi:hypothetical protein